MHNAKRVVRDIPLWMNLARDTLITVVPCPERLIHYSTNKTFLCRVACSLGHESSLTVPHTHAYAESSKGRWKFRSLLFHDQSQT